MIDDAELKRIVTEELEWDPKVDHAHIGVTAADGSVTLSGHVCSYSEKFAVSDAVKRVRGVRAIADEVEVNLPYEHRCDDGEIARRISHVLQSNISATADDVKVVVCDGKVTLSGHVEKQHQREHVESQVRHVGGVADLENRIAIRPAGSAADAKVMIENAMQRSANLDASGVKISVVDDTVTLEGKVATQYERDLAERAAWAAPGIRYVIDEMDVG